MFSVKTATAATVLALFCLAANGLHAQQTTETRDTETTRPEPAPLFQMHYENRVKSFKDQNLVYQNAVLLGDSITEGFDVTRYFPGQRVLNRGISADVIGNDLPDNDKRGILKRLDHSVFNCSPTDVFILIGINDLGMGHTPEQIEAGYREMLTRIREHLPKVNLHIQSVLPCRDKYAKHNENVLDINRRLKALAEEFDTSYIDLHTAMSDEKGELKKEFTNDGLHLNPTAYDIWTRIVNDTLARKTLK